MRDWLDPNRVTVVMWDHSVFARHMPGDACEDFDRILDEAVERGYNTIRIDPIPGVTDLARPEEIVSMAPVEPYHPWIRPQGFEGPLGEWVIEFMEKLLARNLNYWLSAWYMPLITPASPTPHSLAEDVAVWTPFLQEWKKRFGFDNCLMVDLCNEYPHFPLCTRKPWLNEQFGEDFSAPWNAYVIKDCNAAMARMRRTFPELRFTMSTHGDVRWTELPLELDCLDVHFYACADPRWEARTRFSDHLVDKVMFNSTDWHADFSDRCIKTSRIMKAQLRARQRAKVRAFADWGTRLGMPLTTSESWASWYYLDAPDLDWSWLLEWAEWSVEDAIDFKMWGWTPHNYCQPQFENWKDVKWHQRLTERFLKS
jgi:hypothetical protein